MPDGFGPSFNHFGIVTVVDAGFPKTSRLTETHEYNAVFAEARRIVVPALILLFRKNGLNYARLGLAISKKHVKLAVQRNLVKRLVRERFRLNQESLSGVDMVFVSRAGLHNLDRQQICQQLSQLFEKLRTRRVSS